jgi:hypothetical protein
MDSQARGPSRTRRMPAGAYPAGSSVTAGVSPARGFGGPGPPPALSRQERNGWTALGHLGNRPQHPGHHRRQGIRNRDGVVDQSGSGSGGSDGPDASVPGSERARGTHTAVARTVALSLDEILGGSGAADLSDLVATLRHMGLSVRTLLPSLPPYATCASFTARSGGQQRRGSLGPREGLIGNSEVRALRVLRAPTRHDVGYGLDPDQPGNGPWRNHGPE